MNIPPSLLDTRRWICWRYVERDGKKTKVPFQPTGVPAKSNDERTWYTYEHVKNARGFDGVGIMLGNGLVGIDLDHVVNDEVLQQQSLAIIAEIGSYTELSPSGTGYHILSWGKLPAGKRRSGFIECYDSGRFFTFTGQRVDGTPDDLQNRQAEITAFHCRVFPVEPAPVARLPVVPLEMDDADLLKVACRGMRFDKLWRGDISEYANDHSRADYALCHSLAFWTQGDAGRVDRLFRLSGLMREKWDRRAGRLTYGQLTVTNACRTQMVYYDPRRKPESDDRPRRELTRTEAPLPSSFARQSVEDARATIFSSMWAAYHEQPRELLLIRAAPGTGKTTEAIKFASFACEDGQRVNYHMPRHDFFENVSSLQRDNGLTTPTYRWLPRQKGSETRVETCRYAEEIATWMSRGYDGIRFCIGVCGGNAMKTCPYQLQSERTDPLICSQHAHAALGHPMEFNTDMGDETPLGAFLRRWHVKTDDIVNVGMGVGSGLYKIFDAIRTISRYEKPMQGRPLFDEIARLADIPLSSMCVFLESAQMPLDAQPVFNTPYSADEIEQFPVWHQPHSVYLLLRECKRYSVGQSAISRVYVGKGALGLLLRNPPAEGLSDWLIWLDATANERIYAALFGRPVRLVDAYPALLGDVYQVWNRANGISTLRNAKDQTEQEARARATRRAQTLEFVWRIISERGYNNPAVITFKDFEGEFKSIPGVETGHFGGARGTNDFIACDACFVIGTPMPSQTEIVSIASQVFFERDEPFDARWTTQLMRYDYQDEDGNGWEYPVSGFWNDADLQAIVTQMRDDEILQAAHRVRPILRTVDMWLMTNIPIAALPPKELVDMQDVLTHDPHQRFETSEAGLAAARALSAHGPYTRADFEKATGLSQMTSRKVFNALLAVHIIVRTGSYSNKSKLYETNET